jgi:hypothetical protein
MPEGLNVAQAPSRPAPYGMWRSHRTAIRSSIDDAHTSYEVGGYCFSPPLLVEDEVSAAAAAAHDVLDGRYQK